MTSLVQKLTQNVGQVFSTHDLPEELGQVQVSDRPDLAQFQCNGAMAAAKIAKKNPRDIANDIAGTLKESAHFSKVEIAGPGFINIDVTDEYLVGHIEELAKDERLGALKNPQDETIILDYGGPNIAKPMHVGHLRAAIIGDTLRRLYSFAGYNTLGDVHMGDWGTHMGMIISEYIKEGKQEQLLNIDLDDPEQVAALMNHLSEIYPKIAAACKEDKQRLKEAQEATVQLQNRHNEHIALWDKIKQASVKGMKRDYEQLDVHFDLWKGEADVHEYIEDMVEDLKGQSLAIEDQGALIIDISEEDDKKELPPLILYKSDGAVMYGTTDMATIVERMKLYDPKRIVYVVDQRQSLHFVQVFRACRNANIASEDKVELTHAGFGTMNGTDGKPFKTRAGDVMRLRDLMDMATQKARERIDEADLAQDMDKEEKEDIAHKVAIAAIKFADLQNQRTSDYIFDLDRLTSFEGKTGPYLLYQAVRINSLLKKAQDQGHSIGDKFIIKEEDRALALLLSEFPDYFALTLRTYMPHHLCEYVYKLATTFSSFYAACHILSEEDEALRSSRLALCALTHRQLVLILELLGIQTPERM